MYWHARANGAIIGTYTKRPMQCYWNKGDDRSWVVINAPSRKHATVLLNTFRMSVAMNAIVEVFQEVK
jgi:hypothetical protein